MKFNEFIKEIAILTQNAISKYEQFKELNGKQKKARVDEYITDYVELSIDKIGLNFIAKFVIKKLILENVPTITQIIFDLLAAKVKGITKECK